MTEQRPGTDPRWPTGGRGGPAGPTGRGHAAATAALAVVLSALGASCSAETGAGSPASASAPPAVPPSSPAGRPASDPASASLPATPTTTPSATTATGAPAAPTTGLETAPPTSPDRSGPTAPGAGVPADFRPADLTAPTGDRWFVAGTAGTGSPALVATSDAGRSWVGIPLPRAARVPADGDGSTPPARVAFATDRAGAFATGGYLWTTADGGGSWELAGAANASVEALAATPSAVLAVLRTSAGWTVARAPAGSRELATVLTPARLGTTEPSVATSGSTVLVVAGDRTLRSTDGGRTYASAAGPCSEDLGGRVAASGSAAVAWCATGTQAGAWLSVDGGRSFRRTDVGGANSAVAAPTGNGSTFVVGADEGLTRIDGSSRHQVGPDLGRVAWLGFGGPSTGYAIGSRDDREDLFRTGDGGTTWTRVAIG